MNEDKNTVQKIYAEMQKGYDTNQAMTVVINGGKLDPEWSSINAVAKGK